MPDVIATAARIANVRAPSAAGMAGHAPGAGEDAVARGIRMNAGLPAGVLLSAIDCRHAGVRVVGTIEATRKRMDIVRVAAVTFAAFGGGTCATPADRRPFSG